MRAEVRPFEALDDFPDPVVVVDRGGLVVYASCAAQEQLERLVGPLKDRDLLALVAGEDRAALSRLLGALAERPRPEQIEVQVTTLSGPRSWELSAARAPSGRPGHALLAIRDRTEERVVRERLTRSEEMWRSIAENPFDFVMVVSRDGVIEYINRTAEGMSREDVVGRANIYDFVSPETRAVVRTSLDQVFETGKPVHYETFVPILGLWFSTLAGPVKRGERTVAASLLCRDISAHKRTEEAARRGEEVYRKIVENTRDAILMIDAETRTTFVNAQMERMIGYRAEEILGRPPADFIDPELRPAVSRHIERRREGKSEVYDMRFRHKDGSDVWTVVSASPLHDENGAYAGAVAVMTDVTERRRLQEGLQNAQKMEAVGQLAGGVAHEFNNLLTGIIGATELLGYRLAGSPEVLHELQGIRSASDRAASLVRRLLAFARKQSANPRVVDLREIVEGAQRILASAVGEDVEIEIALDPKDCAARVDPAQIEQVLLNIVMNARDAMPDGGTVVVSVEPALLKEGLADLPPGEYVRLAIRDSGTGMSQEVLDRIFEPFFTTKAREHGSGLGLSIVYGVIKQSGGHVTVESAVGSGANFTIYLPRVAPEAAPEPPPESPSIPRGTETILVVEDDELVRGITVRALRALGYRILLAEDGQDALQVVEQHDGPIDLVLTDVAMPRMGGPELVERLSVKQPGLKVLFVSGYSEESLADRGLLAAHRTFLDKPFTSSMLARKLREVLDR
jgi:PAS domain S-box-containing protein